MSAQENTRLVQPAYEAFARGDMAALAEVIVRDELIAAPPTSLNAPIGGKRALGEDREHFAPDIPRPADDCYSVTHGVTFAL